MIILILLLIILSEFDQSFVSLEGNIFSLTCAVCAVMSRLTISKEAFLNGPWCLGGVPYLKMSSRRTT